jgi:hypothetical protein
MSKKTKLDYNQLEPDELFKVLQNQTHQFVSSAEGLLQRLEKYSDRFSSEGQKADIETWKRDLKLYFWMGNLPREHGKFVPVRKVLELLIGLYSEK